MSQPNLSKWSRRSAYFLFGIVGSIVGYMLGYSLPIHFLANPPFISVKLDQSPEPRVPLSIVGSFLLLLLVTLFGAFGGLLYAIKEKKLELPVFSTRKKIYKLGWISDCLMGVAGAYVVFLIVPGNLDLSTPFEVVKVLGLAIVGGYGGQPLMDKVLGDLLKQVKEKVNKVEERVTENRSLIEKDQEVVNKLKDEVENQAKTLALLEYYLDEDFNPTDDQAREIKELMKKVSSSDRRSIFVEAKKVREINSRTKNKTFMVERTILVFQALVEADKTSHRYYAQLGYALKEKEPPDWSGAKEALDKAIEIRGSLDKDRSFWVYEFNRAFCRINLDPNFGKGKSSPSELKDIQSDLSAAKKSGNVTGYLYKIDEESKEKLRRWLSDNDISPEDVGLAELLCKSSESNDSNESHVGEAAG